MPYLELNAYTLNAPEAEAVIMYKRLAAGELEEDGLAEWLRDSSISNAVAVGTPVTRRPLHRSRRAVFPHRALQTYSLA
jgi:hypothetical protein